MTEGHRQGSSERAGMVAVLIAAVLALTTLLLVALLVAVDRRTRRELDPDT